MDNRKPRNGSSPVLRIGTLLSLLILTASPESGHSQTREVALALPDRQFLYPTEPLTFTIPSGYPEARLARLGLELDDIDITRLVRREGERAIVRLPEPLSPGKHRLRLVYYAPDGSIIETGYWELDVRESRLWRQSRITSNGTLSAYHRMAEDSRTARFNPDSLQAGMNLALELEGDDGSLQLATGAVANTATAEGRSADLTGYALSGAWRHLDATIGDQTLAPDNLIISGYARRGISGGIRSGDGRHQIRAFTLLSSPVSGASTRLDDGTRATDRVSGGWAQSSLLDSAAGTLAVQLAHVSGDGRQDGEAAFADPVRHSGSATTLVLDGMLLRRQLRLRGEIASSRFDFDADDPRLNAISDRAWMFNLLYQPNSGNRGWGWNLGIDIGEVGTWFRSLANPNLPTDRSLRRISGSFLRDNFQLQLSAGRETDNVADLPGLPRLATDLYQANIAWASGTPLGILGQFSLGLAAAHASTGEDRAATAGTAGYRNRSRSYLLSLGSSHTSWSWNFSQGLNLVEDNSPFVNDSRQTTSTLDIEILLGQIGTLTPRIAWSRTRDRDLGLIAEETLQIGLAGNLWLSPQVLAMSFDAALNREQNDIDPQDEDTATLMLETVWFAIPATGRSPGISVKASASYEDIRNRLTPVTNSGPWAIFLGMEVGWEAGQGARGG